MNILLLWSSPSSLWNKEKYPLVHHSEYNSWELHTCKLCFIRMLEILTLSDASKLRHVGRVVDISDWPLSILSFSTRFKIFYLNLHSIKPCWQSYVHFYKDNWSYVKAPSHRWDSKNLKPLPKQQLPCGYRLCRYRSPSFNHTHTLKAT